MRNLHFFIFKYTSRLEGITGLHTQWNLFQAPWHTDKSEITFERLFKKKACLDCIWFLIEVQQKCFHSFGNCFSSHKNSDVLKDREVGMPPDSKGRKVGHAYSPFCQGREALQRNEHPHPNFGSSGQALTMLPSLWDWRSAAPRALLCPWWCPAPATARQETRLDEGCVPKEQLLCPHQLDVIEEHKNINCSLHNTLWFCITSCLRSLSPRQKQGVQHTCRINI